MLHLKLVLLILLLHMVVFALEMMLVLASHFFLPVRVGDGARLGPCLDVKVLLGYVLLNHLVMVLISFLLVVVVADW